MYVVSSFTEFLSLFFVFLTYPIDLTRLDPKPAKADKTPILLIHGYLHTSSAWILMRRRLAITSAPIYTINLGSPFHSIEDYVEMVKQKAKEIAEETGRPDLFIVGHSMGGVVASYYATECSGQENPVLGVVTIGSPLQGTKVASFGIGQSAKDMRINSACIRDLKHAISVSKIPFLHIGTTTDLIVRPTRSAFPEDNQNATYVKYNRIGHVSLLYAPSIAKQVAYFYQKVIGEPT